MPLFGPPNVAKLQEKRNVRKLSALLGADDARLRLAAAKALGAIGDPGGRQPLIGRFADADPQVRRAAVEAVGALGGAEVPTLRDALDDADPLVRVAAVRALAGLGEPGVQALHEVLVEDRSELVRVAAADALDGIDRVPDAGAPAAAYRVVRGDWDGCVALGRVALGPLGVALDAPDEKVRTAATTAIGAVAVTASTAGTVADGAIDALRTALADPSRTVRRAAVDALAGTGTAEAAPPLVATLDDEDAGVRLSGVRALALLVAADPATPAAEMAEVLVGALTDRDDEVRTAAAGGLVAIGGPAVGPLCLALADTDPGVRLAAVETLGGIGDPAAAQQLCVSLADTEPEVQAAAEAALTGLGEAAARPLRAVLKDPAEHVRTTAARILAAVTGPEGTP